MGTLSLTPWQRLAHLPLAVQSLEEDEYLSLSLSLRGKSGPRENTRGQNQEESLEAVGISRPKVTRRGELSMRR